MLDWLYGRQGIGIKLGLQNMETLLARLGNPERAFQSVHVAGTNGKGTVTTLLADTIRRAGFRVGAYTSPHLEQFGERMTIDGVLAKDDEVAALLTTVRPHVDALDEQGVACTFFEILTAMAFLHFQNEGVQWAVLETGLGGRLDATNTVMPALTIITNVGLDHQDMLGDNIVDIAAEKAGIMKPGVPCITGAQGLALTAIKAQGRARNCPMATLDEDFHALAEVGGFRLQAGSMQRQFSLALAGRHQIRNAALVVAAADALPIDVPAGALHDALREARMPGRLERFAYEGMDVLVDGAHNEDGAVALRVHLADLDWAGFHLIVGFQADKDWTLLLRQWSPLAAHVWGVPLNSPRTLKPKEMAAHLDVIPFTATESVDEALAKARAAGAERIVIAGSLWLAGDARAAILGNERESAHRAQ